MQLAITHHSSYAYAAQAHYTIQTLRLTPRDEPHQRVLRWRLRAPGRLAAATDGYGNPCHTLTLHGPHRRIAIEAEGAVEVEPLAEGRLPVNETLSPLVYAAATPLTQADDRLAGFARRALARHTPAGLLELALAVAEAVRYAPGHTDAASTAAEALAAGHGVCQDHAHVFIAACRVLGIPARYVSGYSFPGDRPVVASHAWADAWLPDAGWTSVDITHRCFASDRLCRLAVGRDYDSAGPIRGMRWGGGAESLDVTVDVRPYRLFAAAP